MKKRCTNSACRRVFSPVEGACPYCGKTYPRMGNILLVDIVLTGYEKGPAKIRAVKALRDLYHSSLRESCKMVEQLSVRPITVASVTRAAAAEKVCFWAERGFRVSLVPVSCHRHP